jgi:hypothetical protein
MGVAMRFGSVKGLKGEAFRRLTGVQRSTFEEMAAVLFTAKRKQKACGGKPNTLCIEDQLLIMLQYWREYRTYSYRTSLWAQRKRRLPQHQMVRKHPGQEQNPSLAGPQVCCCKRALL